MTVHPNAINRPAEYAARRLYDAETVLHAARQSHVDAWISIAYERLHTAIEDYRLAAGLIRRDDGDRVWAMSD
jgi:hypothetical protein